MTVPDCSSAKASSRDFGGIGIHREASVKPVLDTPQSTLGDVTASHCIDGPAYYLLLLP